MVIIMTWMYYKIKSEIEPMVELTSSVDMDTIDDDEVDGEYLQNDGQWGNQRPHYCKIDGVDYTPILDDLQEFESMEWGVIAQILVDCEDSPEDKVYKRPYNNVSLYVSYDADFSAETMTVLPRGVEEPNDLFEVI